jgi:hypothetical protein
VLVETRSQVLRTAGYIVIPAFTPRQAIDEFARGDFDLVLLCHSIPGDIRERLVNIIRAHTSRTPIVSVASFNGQYDDFADATIENDPNLLLDSLTEVLRRRNGNFNRQQRLTGWYFGRMPPVLGFCVYFGSVFADGKEN